MGWSKDGAYSGIFVCVEMGRIVGCEGACRDGASRDLCVRVLHSGDVRLCAGMVYVIYTYVQGQHSRDYTSAGRVCIVYMLCAGMDCLGLGPSGNAHACARSA